MTVGFGFVLFGKWWGCELFGVAGLAWFGTISEVDGGTEEEVGDTKGKPCRKEWMEWGTLVCGPNASFSPRVFIS